MSEQHPGADAVNKRNRSMLQKVNPMWHRPLFGETHDQQTHGIRQGNPTRNERKMAFSRRHSIMPSVARAHDTLKSALRGRSYLETYGGRVHEECMHANAASCDVVFGEEDEALADVLYAALRPSVFSDSEAGLKLSTLTNVVELVRTQNERACTSLGQE
jgi:hypothetical protein